MNNHLAKKLRKKKVGVFEKINFEYFPTILGIILNSNKFYIIPVNSDEFSKLYWNSKKLEIFWGVTLLHVLFRWRTVDWRTDCNLKSIIFFITFPIALKFPKDY